MLLKAQEQAAEAGTAPPKGPPLSTWSPEMEMLTLAVDRIGSVAYILQAVNGGKGKPPKPLPRPTTAMPAVTHKIRQQRHEALADRLLG